MKDVRRCDEMKGTMFFPLVGANRDMSNAAINTDGIVGKIFNGLHVDGITRTEKGFEVDYTVIDPEIADMLKPPMVTCSMEPRR